MRLEAVFGAGAAGTNLAALVPRDRDRIDVALGPALCRWNAKTKLRERARQVHADAVAAVAVCEAKVATSEGTVERVWYATCSAFGELVVMDGEWQAVSALETNLRTVRQLAWSEAGDTLVVVPQPIAKDERPVVLAVDPLTGQISPQRKIDAPVWDVRFAGANKVYGITERAVWVFDTETGVPERKFQLSDAGRPVTAVGECSTLLVVARGRDVSIFDKVEHGMVTTMKFQGQGDISAVAVYPDTSVVAPSNDGRLICMKSGSVSWQIKIPHPEVLSAMHLSKAYGEDEAEGERIWYAAGGTLCKVPVPLQLLPTVRLEEGLTPPPSEPIQQLVFHRNFCSALAVHPDAFTSTDSDLLPPGRVACDVVAVGDYGGYIHLWPLPDKPKPDEDPQKRQKPKSTPCLSVVVSSSVRSLCWRPDGRAIMIGSKEGNISEWELDPKEVNRMKLLDDGAEPADPLKMTSPQTIANALGAVTQIDFLRATKPRKGGAASPRGSPTSPEAPAVMTLLAASADGSILCLSSDPTEKITKSGEAGIVYRSVWRIQTAFCAHPPMSPSNTLPIMTPRGSSPTAQPPTQTPGGLQNNAIWALAASPNEQCIATAGADGLVRIWAGCGRQILPIATLSDSESEGAAPVGPVYCLAWSELEDGSWMLGAGHSNGMVFVWECQIDFESGGVQTGSIAWVLLKKINMEADLKEEGSTVEEGKVAAITGLAFESSIRFPAKRSSLRILATNERGQGMMWRATTGEKVRRGYKLHGGRAQSIEWSASRSGVVSCGVEGGVCLWNVDRLFTSQ